MAYIGKEPVVGNFQVCDAITVVNGQAAYSLTVGSAAVNPESANHMLVSLNGILQKPGSSFTISGSTITFASNLVTNDVIDFIQILGNVLDLGQPSDDTVKTASLQAGAVTEAKIGDLAVAGAKIKTDAISAQTALAAEPADTDEFLVSDAGVLKRIDYSLIKGGGGLIHLQTQNISSNVASVDFTSNIDSTYDSYKLFISDLKVATDGVEIFARIGASSFENNNYNRAAIGRSSDGSTQVESGNGSGNTGVYLTKVNFGNASDESFSAELTLAKPSTTDTHKLVHGRSSYVDVNGNGNVYSFMGFWSYDVTAVTRLQIIASSGNISRGNFTLFGVANS